MFYQQPNQMMFFSQISYVVFVSCHASAAMLALTSPVIDWRPLFGCGDSGVGGRGGGSLDPLIFRSQSLACDPHGHHSILRESPTLADARTAERITNKQAVRPRRAKYGPASRHYGTNSAKNPNIQSSPAGGALCWKCVRCIPLFNYCCIFDCG